MLVLYFVLAVILIAAAINAIIFVAVGQASDPPPGLEAWLDRPYWIWTTLAVVGVIAAGTLQTGLRLRGGGKALAEMIGARRIPPAAESAAERQLVNVVEEMSIASGTPVPALYMLDDEAGINAFVARTRPTETVMVVTRGALDAFSRDELQGVVAHEYSHVFNGDMRINLRLLGVLARAGARSEADATAAYQRAYSPFALGPASLPERRESQLARLSPALARLARSSPLLKKNVITACADCIIHDGRVTAAEAELLQAIALTLDCPMPPLLDA